MSEFEKEIIEKALKDKKVADFEITKEEILENLLDINKIFVVEEECCKNNIKDKCGSNGFHFKLVKNTIGKISLQSYPCPKNKMNKSLQINNNIAYSSIELIDQKQLLTKESLSMLGEEPLNDQINLINFLLEIKKHKSEPLGCYISGDTATGKTYFAVALANELALQNKKIAYVVMNNLCMDIMQTIKSNDGQQAGIIDILKEVDLLILDDLGTEKYSNYIHSQILIPILNFRFAAKKQTFFISKYNLIDLKKIYNSLSTDASIRIYIDKIDRFSRPNIFRLFTKLKK
ncbi:MAG: ATP-binding protein [Mycoplasma sp.]